MGRRNELEKTGQTISEPWDQAQPYIQDIMSYAQGLYESGQGQSYYPGETYVGMGPEGEYALDQIWNLASQGNPNLGAAQGLLGDVLANGFMPSTTSDYRAMLANATPSTVADYRGLLNSGDLTPSSTGMYRDLYDRAQQGNEALDYLRPTASGDYLGTGNPFLEDIYNRGADDITNRLKTIAVGSGRYGSDWFGNTLGDNLGGLYSSIYAPAYESERDRMLSAAGMIGQFGQQDFNNQATALSGMTNAEQMGISNRLGVLGALTNAEQMGFGNRMGVLGELTGAEQGSLAAQLSAAGMLPALDAMKYNDAERLAQVAGAKQADQQAAVNADIDRYNFEQMAPWTALGNYSGVLGSLPMGGTTTEYGATPGPFAGALSGAATGFNIGAKLGHPLLGTIGGGLLGFFA